MHDRFLRRFVLAGALALAALPALSQPKSLFWRALDVRARLDEAGRLHVVERHAMVFTGDWNGGERIFRIEPGQTLSFEGLSRIDPTTGQAHPLANGDLSAVDQFSWKDPRTLRWRSRLPSDPPFDRTELDYEISYTFSGILTKLGSLYRLSHDFALPDRVGAIQALSLELTLDPAWRATASLAPRMTAGPLAPGQGYVVTIPLEHHGAARPIAAVGTSAGVRRVFFALFSMSVFGLFAAFWKVERRAGRWAPVPQAGSIDPAWLEKNVFWLLPEEAGALWDEKIGSSEVGAVLARLSVEKKISGEPMGKKMILRLLVPIEKLSGYEHGLASGLFFGGRKETDTDAVRAHYKGKGFDPVAKIKPGIEQRLRSRPELQGEVSKPSPIATVVLVSTGLFFLLLSVVVRRHPWPEILGSLIGNGIAFGVALVGAYFFRNRLDRFATALTFLWLPAYLIYAWSRTTAAAIGPGVFLLIGTGLLQLGLVSSLFHFARIRTSPARIAFRKRLLAARRFFAAELSSRSPRLSDEWYPYVLAFGLGPDADRWVKSFGIAAAAATAASSGWSPRGSESSSSASSSGQWTGGGGSFGGAGASVGWAAAASSVAAGVSAPSSSSGGGGGGGGGGGSSGGGGGGGW